MLTPRAPTSVQLNRTELRRLLLAAGILILALTAILGADILPEAPLSVAEGQLVTRDIVAPKSADFESAIRTAQARQAASDAVPPQYNFTTENAIAIAAAQQVAFEDRVGSIDTTFSADLTPEGRKSILKTAIPGLTAEARDTLVGLDAARWAVVRTEAARVLDATLRTELRDTEVAESRTRLPGRIDATATTFASANDLASAFRRAEAAHGEHEKRTGQRDENWPDWYAAYMVAEQSGKELPQ